MWSCGELRNPCICLFYKSLKIVFCAGIPGNCIYVCIVYLDYNRNTHFCPSLFIGLIVALINKLHLF